jgi:hypothetical protein
MDFGHVKVFRELSHELCFRQWLSWHENLQLLNVLKKG